MMKYFILLIVTLFSHNALAQSSNDMAYQRVIDRLDRIERDLNLMEEQFYKGVGNSSSSSSVDIKSSPKLEVRITAIEEQMRMLNGKLEERDFGMRNINDKLDRLVKDIDYRLNVIEQKEGSGSAASGVQPPFPPQVPPQNQVQVQQHNQPLSLFDTQPINQQPQSPQLVGKLEPTTRESTAPIDTMGQYDRAFEYLRNADYAKAEVSLRDFIAGNQQSDLVSNAYYWLGETYFVRGNYDKSAVNFLKGYQEKPQGNKAADNLLKLGISLDKLNKKKEACTTFAKLSREFPDADPAIKDKISAETKRIGCG